ncbi:MAG TPA: SGNH/GDSL hydrolase family protein [Burkholderiales bacterium]|nr:SGNH/GDSL hydrolase family protein [Burkholderiales bacterium]
MTAPTHKRAVGWLINGAVLAGSLVVALLLAEVVLRVIGFSAPVLYTYDDVTGSRLLAGAAGWQRAEGEAFVAINRDGLRDREHSRTKPPNTFRIAILGDSIAEAVQVPLESTFASVLERQLKSCKAFGNRDVEVINFGVSGYGTAQELLTFRHRAAAYSPDLTVLAFYAGNDLRNNSKELEPFKLRPFFSIQDGNLVLDNSFLGNREYLSFKSTFDKRRIFFGLRTFQLIRKLKSAFEQREAGATHDGNIEPGLDDSVFLAPTAKAWKEAWRITERLIVATRDEVVAGGGRFLVLSIPIGIQVHPNLEVRSQFMRTLHVDDLWYPESRIREFAQTEKIDALTLGRSFQSYAEKNQVYLHGFKNMRLGTGHLNESGHKLVGEALAKHLCPSP